MQTRALRLTALTLALLLAGCAGKQIRAISTKTAVSIEHGLNTLQDASFAICDPAILRPNVPTVCTETSAKAGLTTERYRTLHRLLDRAYELQIKTADELDRWQPGDAPPATFRDLIALVEELSVVANGVARFEATAKFFDGLRIALDALNEIAKVVGRDDLVARVETLIDREESATWLDR